MNTMFPYRSSPFSLKRLLGNLSSLHRHLLFYFQLMPTVMSCLQMLPWIMRMRVTLHEALRVNCSHMYYSGSSLKCNFYRQSLI